MSELENVIVDTDGPVATITLNRPEQAGAHGVEPPNTLATRPVAEDS